MTSIFIERRVIPAVLLLLSLYIIFAVLTPNYDRGIGFEQSVTQVDRSPSWLRQKALEYLPLSKHTGTRSRFVEEGISMVQTWAIGGGGGNSNETGDTAIIFDVISVGTAHTMNSMMNQKRTWFSNHGRDMYMATEEITDKLIIPSNGSCQELRDTCGKIYKNEDAICFQRRMGLAIGASVRKYRKLISTIYLSKNAAVIHVSDIDESTAAWKQATHEILPNYLIVNFVTDFDPVSYNTTSLNECMGKDNVDTPIVYAPFTSSTTVNMNGQHQNHMQSFAYPTNATGVVFNKESLKIWIQRIKCHKSDKNTFYLNANIDYDPKLHPIEHSFCTWDAIEAKSKPDSSNNIFDYVIKKVLEVSMPTEQIEKNRHEFELSTTYQPVSMSDIISIYAANMHSLCKVDNLNVTRIPSIEEMLGYLVHRFRLSNNGMSSEQLSCIEVTAKYNSSATVTSRSLNGTRYAS